MGSTLLLMVILATPAAATVHRSVISGFEFYATSTQGRFAGSAAGQGADGLTGAWSIVVDHTSLVCSQPNQTCGHVTGGRFSLVGAQPATIVLVDPGRYCTNQRFWIVDGLHDVGAREHDGTGSFGAYLTHYRHSI